MKIKHTLKLIDGNFIPSEARKVINDLLSSKINYHQLEAFSIKERFNGDVSNSEKRITELKEARKILEEITAYANEKGLCLKIQGNIEITILEK